MEVPAKLVIELFSELMDEHHAAVPYDSDEYGQEHEETKAACRKRCRQCALLWKVRKDVLEPGGIKFKKNGYPEVE